MGVPLGASYSVKFVVVRPVSFGFYYAPYPKSTKGKQERERQRNVKRERKN